MYESRTIDAFQSTLQASLHWVGEYARSLGRDHPPLAYRCLRAALHVLRDRLPAADAVALSAELPMLLRGAYFEGYDLRRAPDVVSTPDELYLCVARELGGERAAPPDDVMSALFGLLNARVDAEVIEALRSVLPDALRPLWPEPGPRPSASALRVEPSAGFPSAH